MLKLGLKRFGRINLPYYRGLLVDIHRNKIICEVGIYDPRKKIIILNSRIVKWALRHGAKPTLTFKYLIQKSKIILL
uniref:ribosomal protein S16 n=1 Tax=Haramonas pauciplastida TaxID=478668 RepID=UPI0021139539|nr:ribosomal protein S16 [Haramonas pauciplastida]UTE94939.1 ribosomal protein S16 [Haramonas pauciplastida]